VGFGGEGVVAAAARAVQPPDLAPGILVREHLKHGEDWRGTDAGADQEHRRLGVVEDEAAARRCDLELIADPEAGVQIAAGGAVLFSLHRDPVVVGVGRPRHGVVAEQRRGVVVRADAQREVLTWLGRR